MNIANMKTLANFLFVFFGGRSEIVLFDTEKILCVHNPSEEGRVVGAPLGDVESRFLAEKTYKTHDFVANYRSLTKKREKLRSATLFIKDSQGVLRGMLTINLKVDRLIDARSFITELINGFSEGDLHEPAPVELFESLNISLEDHVATLIKQEVHRIGISIDRLKPAERRELVKTLDEKGVFLIKGSVAEVARQTASSIPTIYRYLTELTQAQEEYGKGKATKVLPKKKSVRKAQRR